MLHLLYDVSDPMEERRYWPLGAPGPDLQEHCERIVGGARECTKGHCGVIRMLCRGVRHIHLFSCYLLERYVERLLLVRDGARR
jgi:hypothetical protein